jgi:hypothetical protein
MLSVRPKQKLNRQVSSAATVGYIKDYMGISRGKYDVFTQAAKEYAVKSCMDNIASLKYGLDNKLISGKPYTLSELYEQAIYAERAFTAGIQWALQYFKNRERKIE